MIFTNTSINNPSVIIVKKESGEEEPFLVNKLIRSLRGSGASEKNIQTVLQKLKPNLYSGITTRNIYHMAYKYLRSQKNSFAARYSLKKAIFKFGPDGYPFEKFIAALYSEEGYKTKCNVITQGKFVSHEIDVIASKNKKNIFAECKFHRSSGTKCDVKVALYIFGRWTDLKNSPHHKNLENFHLITNTKFTSDALKFGTGIGLQMTSWSHPEKNNLRKRIEKHHLHPITCLVNLTQKQKRQLMEKNIVLCRELLSNLKVLNTLRLKTGVFNRLHNELNDLIQ